MMNSAADGKGYEGPASEMISTCPRTAFEPPVNQSKKDSSVFAPGYVFGTGCVPGKDGDHSYAYEDGLLAERVVDLVERHDPATPLFVFWAPHLVHTPLQVPPAFFEKFDFVAPTDKLTHERQIYHAMVNFADTMIGNATEACE